MEPTFVIALSITLAMAVWVPNEIEIKKFGISILEEAGLREKPRLPIYSVEDNKPVVYHAVMTDISILTSIKDSEGKDLPDSLIISPGNYNFLGETYDLNEEGMYRLIYPGLINEQRIVYNKNTEALLSSVAWMYTHGSSDDRLSYEEINQKALHSKIFATCGSISTWLFEALKNQGIEARMAYSITLDEWDTWSNGHTMVEVYRDDYAKWVLYDLDFNQYFVKDGVPLSLVEFSRNVPYDDYEIKYLANDVKFDISNFASFKDGEEGFIYAFLTESIVYDDDTLRDWFKRAMQVPMIKDDDGVFYFYNDANPDRVMEYETNSEYLNEEDFMIKFYEQTV